MMPDSSEPLPSDDKIASNLPQDIQFINTPAEAQTIVADTLMFAAGVGTSSVRLQFSELIPGALDSTAPGMRMRYSVNVAMPLDGFINMVRYLNSVVPKGSLDEIDHAE